MGNEEGIENLDRYIIRASFFSERMTYIPDYDTKTGTAKVIYESKGRRISKISDAVKWLAPNIIHVSYQMESYFKYYSNLNHGMKKNQ